MEHRYRKPRSNLVGRSKRSSLYMEQLTAASSATQTPLSLSPKRDSPPKDSDEYLKELVASIFYPHEPKNVEINDRLPFLTSSNKVDVYLYALVGLLLSNFVISWYSRITDDRLFIEEVVKVISKVTRNLEARLKTVDIETLLLDDIPKIIDDHIKKLRLVQSELGTATVPYSDFVSGFQAISLKEDESYWEDLSEAATRLLVAHEDQSELSVKFVATILSMVFSAGISKLSEPYQILEIITLIFNLSQRSKKDKKQGVGLVHWFKQTGTSISHMIAYTTSVTRQSEKTTSSDVPVAYRHVFSLANTIFRIQDHKPFVYSAFRCLTYLFVKANKMFENLLNNLILSKLSDIGFICFLIRVTRTNLFPTDQEMGPPRIPPTEKEMEVIVSNCHNAITKGVPEPLRQLLLGNGDVDVYKYVRYKEVNEIVVKSIFKAVVARLLPELCK